jgi:hypothetical protein
MSHPFTCDIQTRVTTAMFVHGAGGTAAPRGPAFRGLMRYWLRAALGAVATPAELRRAEERVFGAPDPEKGRGVGLRVGGEPPRTGQKLLLPHHRSGVPREHPSPSSCILPGASFVVTLCEPAARGDEDALRAAAWSFWLAASLGGFGQRARRGAGSLQLGRIETGGRADFPPDGRIPGGTDQLAERLRRMVPRALSAIRRLVPGSAMAGAPVSPPPFPMLVLEPKGALDTSIVVAPLQATQEQDARAEVMRALRPHKSSVFGLPYMKPAHGDHSQRGRHASPLWVHLCPTSGGGFLAVYTVMLSQTARGIQQARMADLQAFLQSRGGTRVF